MSPQDTKKFYNQLKILSDVFLPSSRPLDYNSVLRRAAKHFKMLTGADASVLLVNNNFGTLVPMYSIGIPLPKIKDIKVPSWRRLKDILAQPIINLRYASFMNTPLIHNRKLVGLSAVFSYIPDKFCKFDYDKYEGLLLTMLAGNTAVNIENANLMDLLTIVERSKLDLENVFDAMEDLISIHDEDFNIIRANKAIARRFKMDIRKIIGKKCYRIFHGTSEPLKNCPHVKSRETKQICTEEVEDSHMGGIFQITAFPQCDASGNFLGAVCVAKDITKQKKMLGKLSI